MGKTFAITSEEQGTVTADEPSAGTVPTKGRNGFGEVAVTEDVDGLGLPGDCPERARASRSDGTEASARKGSALSSNMTDDWGASRVVAVFPAAG